jgi:hypothetical protein
LKDRSKSSRLAISGNGVVMRDLPEKSFVKVTAQEFRLKTEGE